MFQNIYNVRKVILKYVLIQHYSPAVSQAEEIMIFPG